VDVRGKKEQQKQKLLSWRVRRLSSPYSDHDGKSRSSGCPPFPPLFPPKTQVNDPLTAFVLRYEREGELDWGFWMDVAELRLSVQRINCHSMNPFLPDRPYGKGGAFSRRELLEMGASGRPIRRSLRNFMEPSYTPGLELEPTLRRSPSLHGAGADRIQGIRNSPNGFFAHCTVQKVAMASPFAIERPDNQSAWGELVARLAGGDENAMAELYDRTNRIVYGLALRILGDPSTAEDITMEVYLQVWRKAAHYNPQRGSVLSWLVTLVRSRSIDSLRRRKARRAEFEDSVDDVPGLRDSRPGPELASVEAGRSRIVQRAMADLDPDQRKAIELAYFSGLSHSEVALQTGLPLGTVKTRIRLGMLHLRRLLEPYAGGL
jgi:RNA polymerase sigma-70 factor, ECF subfamily